MYLRLLMLAIIYRLHISGCCIYTAFCLQTLHESDIYCENKQFSTYIVHTNSTFALKVHYTLDINKMHMVFAFRPLIIVL